MRLAIDHVTTYRFSDEPARGPTHGLQRLRLTPASGKGQTILNWRVELDGAGVEVEYDDHHGNHIVLVSLVAGAREVTIRAHGEAETSDEAGVVGRHQGYLPLWHFTTPTPVTRAGPRVAALLARLGGDEDDRLTRLHALSALVGEAIAYAPGSTTVATTAEAALGVGRGVCQDHAHVFIAAARALGIPARYVSGYLLMLDRTEQEAGHGWAEAYVEGLGWVGFDGANAICPDARYVRVATGRDYREAAPITGLSFGSRDETMQVALAISEQKLAS